MLGGVCVAGVERESGRWVRPVREFGHLSKGDITFRNGQMMRPGDRVEFSLVKAKPLPPHVEDWVGDFTNRRPRLSGKLTPLEWKSLLSESLDPSPLESLIDGNRSLWLITAENLRATFAVDVHHGKYEVRLSFAGAPEGGNLPCSDLRWRALGRILLAEDQRTLSLDQAGLKRELGIQEICLAIGLSRPFNGRCWPLVIGVHTIPDYDRPDLDVEAEIMNAPKENKPRLFQTIDLSVAAKKTSPPPVETGILEPLSIASARQALRELFGHASFREGQEPVVRNVLERLDTLAVMPTGAGKSLCYQLPAMLLPRTTVVISPLIALMKDQVDSLPDAVRTRTTLINSTLESDELAGRLAEIEAGRHKLVYAAPERLRQQPFIHSLKRAGLSLLVIDEAHCVDLWGHDFRPDYLFIARAREQLGRPSVLALTATATPEMRTRIIGYLGGQMQVVTTGFFRPNLRFSVIETVDREDKMKELLRICQESRGPGIVYVNSREKAEKLSSLLRRNVISAGYYHAGMEAAARREAQERFMVGRTRVIVATIAFGMGIDKPDVRFILHYDLPESLEDYSQQAGRAGRDGKPSQCILFYGSRDKGILKKWANQERTDIDLLRNVYRFLRQQPRASHGYVVMPVSDLERAAIDAAGKPVGESGVRVCLSLLEQAGLLLRHCDLRTTTSLALRGPIRGDEQFERLAEAARLRPRQTVHLPSVELAERTGIDLPDLEERLLSWQDDGLLEYRGSGREMLLQLLHPPENTAKIMQSLLSNLDQAIDQRMDDILQYASTRTCRHVHLARHFGELVLKACGKCDCCQPPKDHRHSRPAATLNRGLSPANSHYSTLSPEETILTCLRGLPFPLGKSGLVNVLRGSVASAVKADRCAQFAALAHLKRNRVEALIDCLVDEGYLAYYQRDQYRLLALSDKELAGPISGLASSKKSKPEKKDRPSVVEDSSGPPDELLLARLRSWRGEEAKRQGFAVFGVLPEKTMIEIASIQPMDENALLAILGMGPLRLEKYGAAILRILRGES